MGFIKEYEAPTGMVFNYHRIVDLSFMTHVQNTIQLGSYFSKAKREADVERFAKMVAGDQDEANNGTPILVEATFITTPYDPDMTIESAYEYVLSLPEFEGAVMDDTEYMAGFEERVEEIKAELAGQQQTDIQQPQEESDVE